MKDKKYRSPVIEEVSPLLGCVFCNPITKARARAVFEAPMRSVGDLTSIMQIQTELEVARRTKNLGLLDSATKKLESFPAIHPEVDPYIKTAAKELRKKHAELTKAVAHLRELSKPVRRKL